MQETQRKSALLERLDEVLCKGEGKLSSLIDCLIELRSEMETLAGASVRTMHRTAEQAKAHEEALAARSSNSKAKLEFNGEDIDPSTALRLQRKGIVEQFNAQRKRARLQRWIEGTNALAKLGVTMEDEADVTIAAGEVWLYALSDTAVVPAVALIPLIQEWGAPMDLSRRADEVEGAEFSPASGAPRHK